MVLNIDPFIRNRLSVAENVPVIYTLYKRIDPHRLYIGSSIDEVIRVVKKRSPLEINKFVKLEDEIKLTKYFYVNGKLKELYDGKGSIKISDIGALMELAEMDIDPKTSTT